MCGELVAVGIPSRTPATGHGLDSPDLGTLEACIILDEMIIGSLGSFNEAFVDNPGTIKVNFRKVLYREFILKIQGIFPAYKRPPL